MAFQVSAAHPLTLTTDQQEIVRTVMQPSEADRFIGVCNTAVAETAEESFELLRNWYDSPDHFFNGEALTGREIINGIIDSFEEEIRGRVGVVAAGALGMAAARPDAHLASRAFSYDYNEEVFAEIQAFYESAFGSELQIPEVQGDGSWTTDRFFEFAHHLNVAASADIRGKAIKNYNQLVPEDDRIRDPMSRDEEVKYPLLLFFCLGDQVLHCMKERGEIDSNLGAAAAVFGIPGKEINPAAERLWTRIAQADAEEEQAGARGFPVDIEASDRLAAFSFTEGDQPLVDREGMYSMDQFFDLTHEMNVLASADIRGDAVAIYNALVPQEDRIENSNSRESAIRYPRLFAAALGDAALQIANRRESIDAKMGAVLSLFGIEYLEDVAPISERIWLHDTHYALGKTFEEDTGAGMYDRRPHVSPEIDARAEELFFSTPIGRDLRRYGGALLVSRDGTISIADFHELMHRLNVATSSDIRRVAIDKYNAIVTEERFRIDDPLNGDATIVFPRTLVSCFNSALQELTEKKISEGEELSKDFRSAIHFFNSFENLTEEMESAHVKRVSTLTYHAALIPLYEKVYRLMGQEEVTWHELVTYGSRIGLSLGEFDFCDSLRKKYSAASGQEIKGFEAGDVIIANKDALINALDAAIHEAVKKHPQADTIAAKTYQYLVTENPNPRDRAHYEARSREEGLAFGLNHCADNKEVLSRILQEILEEEASDDGWE